MDRKHTFNSSSTSFGSRKLSELNNDALNSKTPLVTVFPTDVDSTSEPPNINPLHKRKSVNYQLYKRRWIGIVALVSVLGETCS